jgi:hypothetical protein
MHAKNHTVACEAYRSVNRGTLEAYVDIRRDDVVFRSCGVHKQDGKRWILLPSKPYREGAKWKQASLVEIPDRYRRQEFQTAALAAVEEFLSKTEDAVAE